MSPTCACGEVFDHVKDLRVHIALATDRWPIERCSALHNDPNNPDDLKALAWQRRAYRPAPDRVFRYVRLTDVEAYKALGWVDLGCLSGTHHGVWATLMESPDNE